MQRTEALGLLERASAKPVGSLHVAEDECGELAEHALGYRGRIEARHITGYLSLAGTCGRHVLEVVESYALVETGMLQAAAWNPSLDDDDILDLTTKLWDGIPDGPGRILPGPARKLRAHSRPVAAAMGALGITWWDHQAEYREAVQRLATGGVAAAETFTTLYAEQEEVRDIYGESVRKDPGVAIERALLVLGVPATEACNVPDTRRQ